MYVCCPNHPEQPPGPSEFATVTGTPCPNRTKKFNEEPPVLKKEDSPWKESPLARHRGKKKLENPCEEKSRKGN